MTAAKINPASRMSELSEVLMDGYSVGKLPTRNALKKPGGGLTSSRYESSYGSGVAIVCQTRTHKSQYSLAKYEYNSIA